MAEKTKKMPSKISVDFTGVESGGAPSVKVPEGDYGMEIQKAEQKLGKDSGKPYIQFYIKLTKGHSKGVGKVVPHVCSLGKTSLWNLRNLIEACGKSVPSKAVSLDLEKMKGWKLAGTLIDDEYEGKPKSTISAFFPIEDLSASPTPKKGKKDEEEEESSEEEESETAEEATDEEEAEELFS